MLPCLRLVRRAALLFTMSALALSIAGSSFAQSYRSDEFDNKLSRQGAIAKRFIKSAAPSPQDRQNFQAYFEKYYFPSMTQNTPDALGKLEKKRTELFKQFIYPANGSTQAYLSGKAKEFAQRVGLRGGYHPSVTYNALLILGQLDSTYTGESGEPTPDAEANDLLCRVAGGAATRARVPQFMLSAALVGLERHTRFFTKLPKENQSKTIQTLGRVITMDELAGEYDDSVRDWIYWKAGRALANVGTAGPNGTYFMAIGKRVADESVAKATRVSLAGMLGDLKAEPKSIKAEAVVKAILSLAATVAEDEREQAEKFEDLQLRGGRNRTTAPSRAKTARRYHEEDGRIVMERSELLVLFTDLQKGVQAVAAQAQGESATQLTTINEALKQVVRDLSDKAMIDLNVADSIKRMADTVEATAGGGDADMDDLEL